VNDVITTCGVDLPANMSSTTVPQPAVAGLPTNPVFPLFGTPTLPGSVSRLLTGYTQSTSNTNTQVNSLVALASWPGAEDVVWGMAFEGQAAAAATTGVAAYLGNAAPQTGLAQRNVSGSSAAFSAEKIRGADAVFGSYNVSPAFPVTEAGNVVDYGLKGVGVGANAAGATGAAGAVGALGTMPATRSASQVATEYVRELIEDALAASDNSSSMHAGGYNTPVDWREKVSGREKVSPFPGLGLYRPAVAGREVLQVPERRPVAADRGHGRPQDVLVVIEKLLGEFPHSERLEREHRRRRGGQLGIDLGGDRRGRFFVRPGAAANLPLAVEIVDPPASVVEKAGDLADPLSQRAALALCCHVQPPGTQFVHQLCTKGAFWQRIKNAKLFLLNNLSR